MPQNRPLLDRVRDVLAGPLPSAPSRPATPALSSEAYDHMRIDELTIRDVASIIANENRDVEPVSGRSTEENLQNARIAQAHAVINADRMYGFGRLDVVHTAPAAITAALERSPQYQRALDAARAAFRQQEAGFNPIGQRMY